jgi:ABC-2 type transport system ATP-binding protein
LGRVFESVALQKKFGERWALKDMSFSIETGDVFGLVGPNGAGKTTAIRILLGLLQPTGGSARLYGVPCGQLTGDVKRRIGFVLENQGLCENLTVSENLRVWARLYRVRNEGVRMGALLSMLNLEGRTSDRVADLSRGMRQKTALARALLTNPEFIVLDEPTANLDPIVQREILDLVAELRNKGRTVLLSSHNLNEVERACSRVAVVVEGRVVAVDRLDRLLASFQGHRKIIDTPPSKGADDTIRVLKNCSALRAEVAGARIDVLFPVRWDNVELLNQLTGAGLAGISIIDSEVTLEDVFRIVTHDERNAGEAWEEVWKTF